MAVADEQADDAGAEAPDEDGAQEATTASDIEADDPHAADEEDDGDESHKETLRSGGAPLTAPAGQELCPRSQPAVIHGNNHVSRAELLGDSRVTGR